MLKGNINQVLGKLIGSGAAGGFAGGLASNFLTTKSGRKLGKKTIQMGGIAAVGALAYAAYQRYSSGGSNQGSAAAAPSEVSTAPAPESSALLPAKNDTAGQDALGLMLVRAMIAAARSDGRLDAQESQTIYQGQSICSRLLNP